MRIGEATMRRVVEQDEVLFPPQICFADYTPADLEPHTDWLCPRFVDSESGQVKLSHHAWLIEANGKRKAATVRCDGTDCERASRLRRSRA